MSTKARIGIETSKGMVESIYVRFDGYPDVMGTTLKKRYNSYEKASALIKSGSMVGLYYTIEECTRIDEFEPSTTHKNNAWVDTNQDYEYLFRNNKWYYKACIDGKTSFRLLSKRVCNI